MFCLVIFFICSHWRREKQHIFVILSSKLVWLAKSEYNSGFNCQKLEIWNLNSRCFSSWYGECIEDGLPAHLAKVQPISLYFKLNQGSLFPSLLPLHLTLYCQLYEMKEKPFRKTKGLCKLYACKERACQFTSNISAAVIKAKSVTTKSSYSVLKLKIIRINSQAQKIQFWKCIDKAELITLLYWQKKLWIKCKRPFKDTKDSNTKSDHTTNQIFLFNLLW